mmetsp:Transcript_96418/g.249339  ORF Transcript_96418/g.249339 Transcript_96418/m.249339 type:complete len:380 (+) Transcript_96418:92-1231(+)
MKRTNETARKAPAKKAKKQVTPEEASLAVISAALSQAEGLTAEAAAMLIGTLPNSLGIPRDQRHRYAQGFVDAICGELASVEAGLGKAVADAQVVSRETEALKATCEAAVAEAKAGVDAQQAVLQQRKVSLAEDALTFRAARQALVEADAAQATHSLEVGKAVTTKADLEQLLQALETVHEKPEVVDMLVKGLCSHLQPDDSMTTAMPSALSKAPDARGPFDVMVFDELHATGATRLQALGETVQAAEPQKAALAEATRTASAALDAAKERQMAAVRAFRDEEAKLTTAQECLAATRATHKDTANRTRRAVQERDGAEVELELFRQDTLSAFKFLAERTTPAPEAESEPEAAAAPEISEKIQEAAQAPMAPEELGRAGA